MFFFIQIQTGLPSHTPVPSPAIGNGANPGARLPRRPPASTGTPAFNQNRPSWTRLAAVLQDTAQSSGNPGQWRSRGMQRSPRQRAGEQRQRRRRPRGVYCPRNTAERGRTNSQPPARAPHPGLKSGVSVQSRRDAGPGDNCVINTAANSGEERQGGNATGSSAALNSSRAD